MEEARQQRLLLVADFVLAFMWVWSSVIIWIFVHRLLGYGEHQLEGEIVRYAASILNMFIFAYMKKVTNGGAHNPLTVLAVAISRDFSHFLFTVGARIPVQVVGSVYGVRLILKTFPGMENGPRLNVSITTGALAEGFLAFGIVILTLAQSREDSSSFFMSTWISSVCKLALQILGSDLTGGCMNPASVMGWAFAHGEHITKEHLIVYWLAPIIATLAAVHLFSILVKPKADNAQKVIPKKSD